MWVGVEYPDNWMQVIIALVTTSIVATVIMRKPEWRLEYIGFSIVPLVLTLSGYSFILIHESPLFIWMVIAIILVLYFLFMKNIAVFLYQPAKYITYSLEHISIYSNLMASFFLYVSAAMFFILGVGRLRYILLYVAISTVVLIWQTFWIQKIPQRRAWLFVIVISAVMVQAFWALHFWPVAYYVSGGVLTLSLYCLLHLSRMYVTDMLNRATIIRYVTVTGLAFVIVLATSRWL